MHKTQSGPYSDQASCQVQQKHYDIWNTVRDLCLIVSIQRVFVVSLAEPLRCHRYKFLLRFVNGRGDSRQTNIQTFLVL